MELNRKQEEALRIAIDRYRAGEPYTVISGYAGSGKSTTITFIISALGLDPEKEVAYITFTGKASEVLRSKGCPNAMTAHRLLYYSKQLPNGKFIYRPRPRLDGLYKLFIVDEVSMLPLDLWNLLLSHHVPVIACGDPFQLPPISKEQDNRVLEHPHIFLDEVMRQAKESDIIRLSMDIRAGKKIIPFNGNDVRVFKKTDSTMSMLNWADQVITATNKSREAINECMREQQGRGPEPEIGDKVICCHNSWDFISDKGDNPLINGTIGYIDSFTLKDIAYKTRCSTKRVKVMMANISSESGIFANIPIDYMALTIGEKALTPQEEYRIRKNLSNPPPPIEFNYGYAITGHRAQGSQWGKVLVVEEYFPFDKEEHDRWVYTGITRSVDRLTLILK